MDRDTRIGFDDGSAGSKGSGSSFGDRLTRGRVAEDRRLRQQRAEKRRLEMRGCTFSPETNETLDEVSPAAAAAAVENQPVLSGNTGARAALVAIGTGDAVRVVRAAARRPRVARQLRAGI